MGSLNEDEQRFRRAWFRDHWVTGVAFNRFCGIRIDRWEPDGVEFHLPYSDELSAHSGLFHGGVVAALLDTCGSGAVMAGHDFAKGSRLTTVSMSVQYLSVAPNEDLCATAHCTRRGRAIHFANVTVSGATSGKVVAAGHVAVNVAGERPGVPWAASAGAATVGAPRPCHASEPRRS